MDLAVLGPNLGPKPAQIMQDHLDPDCWGMNQDGVMVSCYGKTVALPKTYHYALHVGSVKN